VSQSTFPQEQSWRVLDALLREQLPGLDVQAISDKDYSDGDLILTPPSVRTQYTGSGFASTTDSQRLSYEVVGRFLILCVDEDLSPALIEQAYRSAALADRVCSILAGTRIIVSTDRSEPITLTAIEALPVIGLGTGYVVAIEVPGLAQFPGTNAAGFTPTGGD
jgi:hypothetical protein